MKFIFRIPGAAITRKVVIAVGNGVLGARCLERMTRKGGSITFSIKWARNVLKLLDWVKWRGATAKREMNPVL